MTALPRFGLPALVALFVLGVPASMAAPPASASDARAVDPSDDGLAFDDDDDFGDIDLGTSSSKSKSKKAPPKDEDEGGIELVDDPDWDAPASDPDLIDDLGDPDLDGPRDDLGDLGELEPLDELPVNIHKSSTSTEGMVFGLKLAGKSPLMDNFPASLVERGADSVVVELPVLVARDADDNAGESYWLLAEFTADGQKAAETRSLVTIDTVAGFGPTIAWLKATVPTRARSGKISVTVYRSAEDEKKELFTRQLAY